MHQKAAINKIFPSHEKEKATQSGRLLKLHETDPSVPNFGICGLSHRLSKLVHGVVFASSFQRGVTGEVLLVIITNV